jgi:leader peptidase (prepilin peptidase)/N-methyltransferase
MTGMLWFYGILGAAMGSFLNVCIDRLPEKQSLIAPPSFCPACQRTLKAWELIPVFSYFLLRGKCRTCGERIPVRIPLVELGTGILFALIYQQAGDTLTTLVYSLYVSLLIVIGLIDLEHQIVPNVLIYPAIGLGLAAVPLLHLSNPFPWLLGGLAGFGALFLIAVLAPGAMGMGDVKLVIFIGLINGFPEVLLALFFAFVTGGLAAGILLLLNKIHRKDTIAFGPYLALGGMITLLYGDWILNWWLRRIGA